MEWFTRETVLILVFGSVFAFSLTYTFEYLIKHTDQLQKNTKRYLRLPVFYRFAGFFLISMVPILLFGDMYFTFYKNGILRFPDPVLCTVSFLLFLAGILLVLYCKNYVIILEQDGILSKGVFRKHRKIFWKEIESIQFQKSAFFLYDGKSHIEVVILLTGFEVFLSALEKSVPWEIWEDAFLNYKAQLRKSGV